MSASWGCWLTFSSDLELERLFSGEVEERADALVVGARALADGAMSDEMLQDMYREGHTIKGTARMMGYIAVSDELGNCSKMPGRNCATEHSLRLLSPTLWRP